MRDLKAMGCGIDWRRRCCLNCAQTQASAAVPVMEPSLQWPDMSLHQLVVAFTPLCSFVTTNVNLYYDSFVRWQFEVLHKQAS